MNETFTEKQKRAVEIFKRLGEMYPDSKCALIHKSAWELLVATILSAQCTDKRVNIVTPLLFRKFKTINDFAEADIKELENYIRSTGFFRNKAKNIQGAAQKLIKDYKGIVPDSMEKLITLPGIARKSANVLLYVWFNKNEGVVVDTHVKRITGRLGLTDKKTPEKIEKDLIKLFPRNDWGLLAYYLVDHGRALCKAPTPKCAECRLNNICPSAKIYL
ncbi:endonuclease III [Candidatus Peregrinibacteria bacterium]|nr:endonuclease III [Candidatus Peregrinibacteria bacterium]